MSLSSRERVMCAIAWEPVDRLPIKHEAREEVNRVLMKYLNIKDEEFLYLWLGDDFHRVKPFYCGPVLQRFPDGKWEGPWGEIWHTVVTESGIYNETVYLPYRDTQRLEELEGRRFPSADWYDFSSIRAQCEAAGERCVLFGDPAHFEIINGISRLRGAEQVLMDLASEDPVYLFLADARYHFYYELTERALIASEGKIDIVHCGQDLGTQSGPLISPYTFDRIFAPRLDEYFSMIHGHGAKVMMHSCGSTRKFIPRLIELGLDILDVVQPSAKGMNMQELQDEYAGELCFAGTMDVQTVLPNGCPEDVIKAVELRWSLFKNGGLLIGPSHQIQGDTPIENILAMYHAARNYQSR